MGKSHLPLLWWKCTKMNTFTRCRTSYKNVYKKFFKAKDRMTQECYSRDWNGDTILQMRPGSTLLCKVKWPTVLVWSEANPTEAVYILH